MIRTITVQTILVFGIIVSGAFAQSADDVERLREELSMLQQEVAELRARNADSSQLLSALRDPELASLIALHHARQLEPEQRIEWLTRLLQQRDHSQTVRNTAFLILIEDLQSDGDMEQSQEMLEQMLTENAMSADAVVRLRQRVPYGRRVPSGERVLPGQRVPPGPRVWPYGRAYYPDYRYHDPHHGDRRLELDLRLPHGYSESTDPTGRRLELDMRSPSIYRGHPDDYFRYERYYGDHWRFYRDPFDRPWLDNPRWRRGWWR